MMLKDNNFISAVVYLHNDGARAVEFCRTVAAELDANFKQYELVVVDDACTDDTVKQLRAWGGEQDAPLTILHMSIYHGLEDAMNAGLDAAIGDYVYEFDSTELCYAPTLIMQAYRAALDGSDIVSVCPRTVRGGSSLFYKVFNAHSQSAYRLRTDAFRLVTRRAINRVHASSTHLPYRKAAYAASGLRMVDLEFDGQLTVKQKGRFNLALDSLTLYTNFGFKASVTVTHDGVGAGRADLYPRHLRHRPPGRGLDDDDVRHHRRVCGAVRRADHRRQVSVAALKSDVQATEISCGKH